MVYDIMMPALLFAPDYTMKDIKNVQKGMEFSMEQLFPQLVSFDFSALGYDFTIPFFIFQGEGDIITPVATAKEYFNQINAPAKHFILIKNAGHLAAFCNPAQFLRELLTHVRPLALQNP
jgi:pimeloyl-ACP methyl ester carboxylesterase